MKTIIQLLFAGLFVLTGFVKTGHAQNTESEKPVYKITGKILEKGNDTPVAYAAVALIDVENQKSIVGSIADFDGVFILTGFGNGTYQVQVTFMGFQTFNSPVISNRKSHY